ncbi:MAG: lysophospholipid acyltransferase family protein, partial [Candidatus Kapabacteria bacterium]|nr:lysophospholipid acyltransferase family protein [Candidatus Kapabacteria bacterium]
LLGYVVSLLPHSMLRGLAVCIGYLLRLLSLHRYDVSVDNIRKAFPAYTDTEVNTIAQGAYTSLSITFLELLSTPYRTDGYIVSRFNFKQPELIRRFLTEMQPLIFLSGHFGNWEWGAYAAGILFNPLLIVIKNQRNTQADTILNSYRTRGGNRVVPMDKAAKDIISTIRSKGIVALLTDQAADPQKDIFVDFFSRPAVSFEAPASLALRYQVPVVCFYTIRRSDGTYDVEMEQIDHNDLQNNREGIATLVQRYVHSLEHYARLYPSLWSWQHKRWKYHLNDYPNTYYAHRISE